MSTTMSQFVVLADDGKVQTSKGFLRESQAWEEFWSEVAANPDDGDALGGFDAQRVLASRTGLDGCGHRWYVHLMKEQK